MEITEFILAIVLYVVNVTLSLYIFGLKDPPIFLFYAILTPFAASKFASIITDGSIAGYGYCWMPVCAAILLLMALVQCITYLMRTNHKESEEKS